MKKFYQKPTMNVVKIEVTRIICTSGDVNTANTNVDIEYIGGGDVPANARYFSVWDDEE